MSHRVRGILGTIAVLATFGAVQFASGHDLTVGLRTTGDPQEEVNRAAKTDRAAVIGTPAVPTRTISFHVDRLPATSIVARIPPPKEARSTPPARVFIKTDDRKTAVACEPVVSILTEIAKRLQPGRCLT